MNAYIKSIEEYIIEEIGYIECNESKDPDLYLKHSVDYIIYKYRLVCLQTFIKTHDISKEKYTNQLICMWTSFCIDTHREKYSEHIHDKNILLAIIKDNGYGEGLCKEIDSNIDKYLII